MTSSCSISLKFEYTLVQPVQDEAGYFALVRAAFCQRRKTAANSIAAGLCLPKAKVMEALAAAGISEKARPEQLSLEDFARLQKALAERH